MALADRRCDLSRSFRETLSDASPSILLVVWGGFQLPVAAALAAAREAGIATLFCENGYLPKTIVMDPRGSTPAIR